VREEFDDLLDSLVMERDAKCLATIAYAKGCDAEANAIDVEVERLRARAKVHRNHAKRLREYVERHLPVGTKIADARSSLSWRSAKAVELDERFEDERYCRVKLEPDKPAIRAALEAGEEIKGASIVTRTHLVVK